MGSSESKVPVASGHDRQAPEELKLLHDYYEKWNKEMSGTWYNLVSEKVREILALNPALKIDQCIVFGLGSLDLAMQNQHPLTGIQLVGVDTPAEMHGSLFPNEVRQLIVVRMMMDCIKEAAHPIRTCFQDPEFTELDKAYLRYHGFKVLEDDSGLSMLNSTTLMVILRWSHIFWRAALKTSPKASPAVYVGPSFQYMMDNELVAAESTRQRGHSYNLDNGTLEDYMNITNAYIFPRSESNVYEALRLKPQLEPAAAIGLQLDEMAFSKFEIRVIKTVHKDH
ncbi:hypothetical protein JMJ35_001550 [Cladonia borealis]|uniref:SRR1-like domain-containing protein n=1 Tax=Cladonia borealis TaxID=184061 RepID=A0AA39UDH6_9LECA|nr:hypothetical protein JMJ35_001550 [Cladonia borealis]